MTSVKRRNIGKSQGVLPPYSQLSSTQLLQIARPWSDQYLRGEEGHCPPDEADWDFHCALDLSTFGEPKEWVTWFKGELERLDENGAPGQRYYEDLMHGDIHTPIVLLMRSGVPYIWDGNHRVGAAITRGLGTISAVVGMPKECEHPASNITLKQGQ